MRFLYFYIIICCFHNLSAQEYTSFPDANPILFTHPQYSTTNKTSLNISLDTITLPFIDDFSQQSIYPDSSLWSDCFAYINSSFPQNPPTVGVATLEGLNEQGLPYGGATTGTADYLTSQAIDLSNLSADSNVVLSFFYQPGGFGDAPEEGDSLFMEWKDTADTWITQWQVNGMETTEFKQVLLKIEDEQYFYNGFQFRFRNIALRSGNLDHWHIDYVILDKNRSVTDSSITDIAYTTPPGNILKNYSYMPWNQFEGFEDQEMKDSLSLTIRNLSQNTANVNYSQMYTEVKSNTAVYNAPTTTATLPPYGTFTEAVSLAPVKTALENAAITGNFEEDSVNLKITYQLQASPDTNSSNDTTCLEQKFYDYLAYDDGSAEKVYGINGVASYERFVAYEFTLNRLDTIRGVQFSFSHFKVNTNNVLFNIIIWKNIDKDNAGFGDDVVHRLDFQRPDYTNMVNGFAEYTFFPETPIVMDGTFYVGWGQTDSKSLDVGLDIQNDASSKLYYNTQNEWVPTAISGAVMIRPVLGRNKTIVNTINLDKPNVLIHPNPANEYIFVEGIEALPNQTLLSVYNLQGKLIKEITVSDNTIGISELPDGLYIVTLSDLKAREKFNTSKIFIQH